MASESKRTKAAMLAADGVERVQTEELRRSLEDAGMRVDLIGPRRGEIWAMDDLDKSATFPIDSPLRDASARNYDCLVLPDGVVCADRLRRDPAAVALVAEFIRRGKPVAAAGHAAWLLIEADAVHERVMSAWPSLRTDIVNAGGRWAEEGVCADVGLLTCARTEDLPDLCDALEEALA